MLRLARFVFNMFAVNTYVVYDEDSREAIVIDPGMIDEEEKKALDNFITKNSLTITGIVNTHMHIDHCFGANHVKTTYSAKLMGGDADSTLAASLPEQSARFGLPNAAGPVVIDMNLRQGDKVEIGKQNLEVIEVPGHSPGSIALYSPEQKFVIVGDALFERSIGRTDLPGGNHRQLVDAIKTHLLTLPDDVTVFSGHGNPTTIGQERLHNPFVQ